MTIATLEIGLRITASRGTDGPGPHTFAALPVMQQIKMQESLRSIPYVEDPDLGARMAPSLKHPVSTLDYAYTLRTDRFGFVNRDPWPENADVAVLGDSLLSGEGVGYERQITTLLEQELGGARVLNLVIPGAGTEHQRRVYYKYAEALDPKLVVVTLWLSWDVGNTLRFYRWLQDEPGISYTDFRKQYRDLHRQEAVNSHSSSAGVRSWLRRRLAESYLARAVYWTLQKVSRRDHITERITPDDGGELLLASRDQRRLALGLDRPDIPGFRDSFFGPIEELQHDLARRNRCLLVMLVPSKEEIYGAEAFPAVLNTAKEVRAELERRALPVLDLYPVFERESQRSALFFRTDPHLNPSGNGLVAQALASWILSEHALTRCGKDTE